MPRPAEFSARTRTRNLDTLGREEFDLLVIGGGITGAGVVREASLRGFRVAFADSVHGLRASDGDIAVFAAPRPDAAVLAVYPSRTELAIVGTVVGADYYYVSPCNACESGFVPTSALKAD